MPQKSSFHIPIVTEKFRYIVKSNLFADDRKIIELEKTVGKNISKQFNYVSRWVQFHG